MKTGTKLNEKHFNAIKQENMTFTPLNLFFNFLNSIFTIILIILGLVFLRQWYIGGSFADLSLTFTLLIILISVGGRYFVRMAFSKKDLDPPKLLYSAEGKFIFSYDGTKIYTEEFGDNKSQTIIATHGWGTDSRFWYYLIKYLSTKYRVVVWDLPGFGMSEKPKNNDYSIERYATDLRFVIEKFGGDKNTILLGHSAGGMISMMFEKLYPEVLASYASGMILANTTYTNPLHTSIMGSTLEKLQNILLVPIMRLGIMISPILNIMDWVNYQNGSSLILSYLAGFSDSTSFDKVDFVTKLNLHSTNYVKNFGLIEMLNYRVTENVKNMTLPVLILAGDQDKITEPEAGYFLKHNLPQSEMKVLENTGHLLPIEKWEDFNYEVDIFCRSLPIYMQTLQ